MKIKKVKLIAIVALIGAIISFSGCETFKRNLKNADSELNGGLKRTISVYDYNGDLLKTYEGKCDIEDNDGTGKVLFDIDGKRVIIYNAVVIAEEIAENDESST